MDEIWKDVLGFEGYYQVSNLGRVKSLSRFVNRLRGKKFINEKIKINKSSHAKYMLVQLIKDGKNHQKLLHRLLAEAFIPNPNNYPCVNHINAQKKDNRLENLEWCTYSQNNRHAYDLNLKKGRNRKPVLQFDKSGNLLNRFVSTYEAYKQTAIRHISEVANEKTASKYYQSAGGYVWKYDLG